MRINRQGFGIVEVSIAVAVLIAVGFLGFRVINSNTSESDNSAMSNESANNSQVSLDDDSQQNKTTEKQIYTSPDESYTFDVPDSWSQEVIDGEVGFDAQFETENGYVTIFSYPAASDRNELIEHADYVWITSLDDQGKVVINKSEMCTGSGEETYMGKLYNCDAASEIKTRISVYAEDSLGLIAKDSQVVVSYSSKDNTKPGSDLDELEDFIRSFEQL